MQRALFLIAMLCTGCLSQVSPEPFRIISYNVWFDQESGNHRYPKILDTLAVLDADVICLQEVTAKFMDHLKSHERMGAFHVTTYETPSWYFNVTLTKGLPELVETVNFPGRMGRQAPIVTVTHDSCRYRVANVHLESYLEDTEIRKQQIQEILNRFKDDAIEMIAGDFNFGTGMAEEQLLEDFTDAGQGTGPTFEIGVNPWAPKRSSFPENSIRRLDRIFIRGHRPRGMTYSLFSTPATGGCLSDHYGILLEIP